MAMSDTPFLYLTWWLLATALPLHLACQAYKVLHETFLVSSHCLQLALRFPNMQSQGL